VVYSARQGTWWTVLGIWTRNRHPPAGMDDVKVPSRELKNAGYEIFVGILSILSIVNIVLAFFAEDPNLETVLRIMNGLFSIIFLGDFSYRLFTAESKFQYFFRQFGWADLLASLPFEAAKILRIFRLVRVVRLLRVYGVKNITNGLIKDRAGSALLTLLLMGILVLEFGSLEILHLEQYAPDANITSASDALWYVIVTISTVGYGDQFPVTNGGRLFGSLIIIIGVGIFGTFTGYLANVFLSPSKKAPEASTSDVDVQSKVGQLKELMAQQQATIDEIDLHLQTDGGT
jgi:voltage-gated potassium channel